MAEIFITRPNGDSVLLAERSKGDVITQATQVWELLGGDVVNITLQTRQPKEFFIGDKMVVFGRNYYLNRLPRVVKSGSMSYTYTIEFEGVQYDLLRVTYDLTIDTTNNALQDVQADSLTGNLKRFADVLVSNANRVFPGKWVVGECPETEGDKNLTFGEKDNCLSVLVTLCQNFGVEYTIKQSGGVNTINFVKKAGNIFPFTFEYGRGGGFYELSRQNADSQNLITRLKVFGSTSNITHKYRANRLCLPNKTKGQSFIEHQEAVERFGIFESTKYFEDIKPTFDGNVTAIYADDVLKFKDSNMFDLNAKEADGITTKYLLAGVAAKIHFNTGNLAGYEFNIKSYDHATRTFTLIKIKDERDDEFPSKVSPAFQFAEGDKYKILDVAMPEEYVAAAEARLQTEAETYYTQNSQPRVQYGLSLHREFIKSLAGDSNVHVNIFSPGDYIQIKDESIGVDKAIRVKSIARNLLDIYVYTLTISDTVTANITARVVSELREIDKVISTNKLGDPARARNNWRTTQELIDMVFDPDGDYYTDKIKPSSIDTMALSVGAKSTQFSLANVVFYPSYEDNPNSIRVTGGALTHFTINPDGFRTWNIAGSTAVVDKSNQAYYIYAKCQRDGAAGVILFTTEQIKAEQDPMYYHFWIGVLNSLDATLNVRSVSLTYGFSAINGKFIRAGRIDSTNGEAYFDLDNGEIGGNIKFRAVSGEMKEISEGIDEAVGRIEVGAENLLINTEAGADNTHFYNSYMSNSGITATSDQQTGAKRYAVTANSTDNYYRFMQPTINQMWGLEAGQGYIFSGKFFFDRDNQNIFIPYLQVEYRSQSSGWRAVFHKKLLINSSSNEGWVYFEHHIIVPTDATAFYFGFHAMNKPAGNYFLVKELMFTKGNKTATYRPSTLHLQRAIKDGSTTIDGGLVLSNVLLAKDTDGKVRAGISGLKDDNVAFFAGGTYSEAIADAGKEFGSDMATSALDKKDGSGHRAKGAFAWDGAGGVMLRGRIEALSGKFGRFDIVGGDISGRYTNGEERILLTTGDLPQAPSSMGDLTEAFNNGWGQGYPLANGYFYSSTDEWGQVYEKNSHTYNYTARFTIPEAKIIQVIFGVSGQGFWFAPNQPQFIDSYTVETIAGVYLNGTYLGNVSDFGHFNVTGGGEVEIRLSVNISVVFNGSGSVDWELDSEDDFKVTYHGAIRKTCIGSDGFYSFYSDAEYLFWKREFGLEIKGKTNIPGVLLSGEAYPEGGGGSLWGAKKHETLICEKRSTGTYEVYHSIGHKQYSVQVTPKGASRIACVIGVYENYFVVQTQALLAGGSIVSYNSGFYFTVIGNN